MLPAKGCVKISSALTAADRRLSTGRGVQTTEPPKRADWASLLHSPRIALIRLHTVVHVKGSKCPTNQKGARAGWQHCSTG